MGRLVLKFGGSSLGSVRAISLAANIVRQKAAHNSVVVVVSAVSGVTDTLLEAAIFAREGDLKRSRQHLLNAVGRYSELAVELLEEVRLRLFLEHLAQSCAELMALATSHDHPLRLQDEIVAYGERLSSKLFALVLQEHGVASVSVEAERLIVTTRNHTAGSPLLEECYKRARNVLNPYLRRCVTAVVGGFIGATPEGRTTTLGRGGSDYTATILGAALRVAEVQIWTDVSGIQTADPAIVREAQVIPEISYEDASLLASYGAKVIHHKTVLPVKELGIPIRVCNTFAQSEPNTVITETQQRPLALSLQRHVLRLRADPCLSQAECLRGVTLIRRNDVCWAVFESGEAMQRALKEYCADTGYAAIFLLGLDEPTEAGRLEYVRGGALLIVERAQAEERLRRLHHLLFAKLKEPQYA